MGWKRILHATWGHFCYSVYRLSCRQSEPRTKTRCRKECRGRMPQISLPFLIQKWPMSVVSSLKLLVSHKQKETWIMLFLLNCTNHNNTKTITRITLFFVIILLIIFFDPIRWTKGIHLSVNSEADGRISAPFEEWGREFKAVSCEYPKWAVLTAACASPSSAQAPSPWRRLQCNAHALLECLPWSQRHAQGCITVLFPSEITLLFIDNLRIDTSCDCTWSTRNATVGFLAPLLVTIFRNPLPWLLVLAEQLLFIYLSVIVEVSPK